jgi:hypothetical protein
MMTVQANAAARPAWLTLSEAQEGNEGVAFSISRGRDLARLGVEEVIAEVSRRATSGRLNRGLSLSLPYFDDASLELRHREIVVVPRGRVLFVPAFVVLACEREAAAVRRDPTLDGSTREHLAEALERLAAAFRN